MTLTALHPGASYHSETLEAPRYRHLLGRLLRPHEFADAALRPATTLVVPCRTHPRHLQPHRERLVRFMASGGTLIAMGETFPHLWLPNLRFSPVPTDWWWWLTPGADLGVRIVMPQHALMRGLTQADVTWHLHGWFAPPLGAEVLIADGAGRAILYVDEVSWAPGRLVVTSLDPIYHHGSHFMAATTRFLDRFLPNLVAWAGDRTRIAAAEAGRTELSCRTR